MSTMETNSIRFKNLINMLPIIALMTYYYTHYLEGTYSFIIPLGLVVLWLCLSFVFGKVKGILMNKVTVWWLAYLFLCIIMVILGFSSTNINFIISRLPFFIIPAIGYYVIRCYNKKEKALILMMFAIIFGANLVYNIILGFQLPEIFESLESTEESIEFGIMMNIAPSSFISVSYWLIGALLTVSLCKKKGFSKVFYVIITLPIGYYMLFQNTRGTAVILLAIELVGLVLAYFEPRTKENRRFYYISSSILIVLILLVVFIPLMNWILENIQSERLAERFNDLLDFKKSGGDANKISEGSLSGRLMLAKTSLNSFFSSPISILIGIGDHTTSFGGDLIKSGVGGHSEFIDVLARYGLVGGFVFWNIMKQYYCVLKKVAVERDLLKYVNVVYFVIVLTGFLNNIFQPSMMFFIFMVFPLIIEFTNVNNNKSYGK